MLEAETTNWYGLPFDKPLMLQANDPDVRYVAPPGIAVATYRFTTRSPVFAGPIQETVASPFGLRKSRKLDSTPQNPQLILLISEKYLLIVFQSQR